MQYLQIKKMIAPIINPDNCWKKNAFVSPFYLVRGVSGSSLYCFLIVSKSKLIYS